MPITADDQKLQPGSEIILIEVDCTSFGADVLYFHYHPEPYTTAEIKAAAGDVTKLQGRPIYWQGIRYDLWPYQLTGLETTSDGTVTNPKLAVANLDGSITALCRMYQDLKQAKVTLHRTYAHYLDAINFPNGNAGANPNAEQVDVYYIDSKTSASDETVEFRLSSPLNFQGQKVGRQMTSRCTWCMAGQYRGADCGYTGAAYFDKFGNPVDNPAADECPGTVAGCKLRWGDDAELPFGGFPAIGIVRL